LVLWPVLRLVERYRALLNACVVDEYIQFWKLGGNPCGELDARRFERQICDQRMQLWATRFRLGELRSATAANDDRTVRFGEPFCQSKTDTTCTTGDENRVSRNIHGKNVAEIREFVASSFGRKFGSAGVHIAAPYALMASHAP
jgi:hypothetical protein